MGAKRISKPNDVALIQFVLASEWQQKEQFARLIHDELLHSLATLKYKIQLQNKVSKKNQNLEKGSLILFENLFHALQTIQEGLYPINLKVIGLLKTIESNTYQYKQFEYGQIEFRNNSNQKLNYSSFNQFNLTLLHTSIINLLFTQFPHTKILCEIKDMPYSLVFEYSNLSIETNHNEIPVSVILINQIKGRILLSEGKIDKKTNWHTYIKIKFPNT